MGHLANLVGLGAWRAAHGTPPGPRSLRASLGALRHRDWYLKASARWGPVFTMSQHGSPVICLVGLDRITRLFRDHAAALGPSTQPITESVAGNFLRYMDADLHAHYGRLFRRAMPGSISAAQQTVLTQLCAASLPTYEAPAAPSLRRIARQALSWLLFGAIPSTGEGRRLDALAAGFARAGIGHTLSGGDAAQLDTLRRLILAQVEALAATADEDAPVVLRLRRLQPALPDEICLDNLVVMHRIATDNVSSLMAWLLLHWGTEPEAVHHVRSASGTEREQLLATFLDETLRLAQSEYLYRRVTQDFEFEGFRFPAGWLVRGCVWESHRTAPSVPEPDRFLLTRPPEAYERERYRPFGIGPHACNGVNTNRAICLTFLSHLAASSSVEVTKATPLRRGWRHWNHWQPNAAMRLMVRERE